MTSINRIDKGEPKTHNQWVQFTFINTIIIIIMLLNYGYGCNHSCDFIEILDIVENLWENVVDITIAIVRSMQITI